MNAERLHELLSRRAPGEWELYRKTAESRALDSSAPARTERLRREEGWAARWWEKGALRFAWGGETANETRLEEAISQAGRITGAPETPPQWPSRRAPVLPPPAAVAMPPDLFAELARRVSTESRGEVRLTHLSVRRGVSTERIENARGLDVSILSEFLSGFASAAGRRGTRTCEARALFRWDAEPDLTDLARRLSDRATLPLGEKPAPFSRGELLLDPSVAAALLASVAPLFSRAGPPTWVSRGRLFCPLVTVVDDASADAPFDGEGTPTRRLIVVEEGIFRSRLHDLRSARSSGEEATGHGVRPSYRVPPSPLPRRLFFATSSGAPPQELLAAVRRGLFASALTAPVRVDLDRDRCELEFTGVAIVAGRAQGPVAGARASGRLSEMLRRITGVSTDLRFFPTPHLVGAPTVMMEAVAFD